MSTRVGINGFGRIGRQVLRATLERHPDELEVVAVNDLAAPQANAHLFKYDSNYGRYPGTVQAVDGGIEVDGRLIQSLSERNPADLPWGDLGVDIVIESTGIFTQREKAAGHIEAGAKKVIISAPATGEDKTLVLGVNADEYDPDAHHVLSNASCTTNCVAQLIKVLNDEFGIQHGLMTTVHAYTNDQQILDQVHSDMRRARAAASNIIPTSTGAAKVVGVVIPELNGKLHGMALRVPVPTGSITDFVADVGRDVTKEEVNEAFRKAAEGALNGILEYTEDPIVSSDIKMNPASCIFDADSTMVMEGNMVKVLGWYDNEWGYSCRTSDLTAMIAEKGL
ncbi:MAG: type I glyceraldehyde-3-phosphate dehydrogenase [Chloroflexi bacterium]|nr:type I glyceraldehyde-3-phosphate dehydrogenase [Chloroflexota bacterium]MXY59466.1 type I glyceraldehyde-3-phosphate dehydrogenase [Chloroflexota bacterium]MYA51278.1 type I glyceraldehyde-3-phosphate dehydrogenase [Chloroflexota bacterium]MYK35648.1 type I glyceraldehyde-3-phosphate dehydrogenase [Chloroflexota bacterium]